MSKQQYTIVIYAEGQLALLTRIFIMFSRRRIAIESIDMVASEVNCVSRTTIAIVEAKETVQKLVFQIKKQVEVWNAFFYSVAEVLEVEQALFKVAKADTKQKHELDNKLKKYNAVVVLNTDDYIVYKTSDTPSTTTAVLQILDENGLLEFARSSRLVITRANNAIHNKLKEFSST